MCWSVGINGKGNLRIPFFRFWAAIADGDDEAGEHPLYALDLGGQASHLFRIAKVKIGRHPALELQLACFCHRFV